MVEKAIDLAQDFLDKLIMPAVEETGLLIREQLTFWKFKNQVKILNKTKEYCEKHNISSNLCQHPAAVSQSLHGVFPTS